MPDFTIGVGQTIRLTTKELRGGVVPPDTDRIPTNWSVDGGTSLESANLLLAPVGGNPALDCDVTGKAVATNQNVVQVIPGSPGPVTGSTVVDVVYPFDAVTAVLKV